MIGGRARQVAGKVVVVTGASSGIGRSTARALAENQARVVLAARRPGPLEDAAEECRNLGAEVLAVPTDVTSPHQVEALAAAAVDRFGRIDVWFNNAGVGVFGWFDDIPPEVWRRTIETNLFGAVNGARVALGQFRRQGAGTLINTAAVAGRIGQSGASAHLVSKSALRGLSEALRQELIDEPAIRVCTLLPLTVDTPFYQHAANFTGRRIEVREPASRPRLVAEAVLDLIVRPRPELAVGALGRALLLQQALAPGLATRTAGRPGDRGFIGDEPAAPTRGALFDPMPSGTGSHGGWGTGHARGTALLPLLAAALAALPVGLLAWRRWRSPPAPRAAARADVVSIT
mgnify:CR=1 FL=1